jgi:hypothetical protein
MSRRKANTEPVVDQLDTVASIRRGLDQACRGLGRSAEEVLDDLERDCEELKLRGQER